MRRSRSSIGSTWRMAPTTVLLAALSAHAQHPPLTGQMLTPSSPAATTPVPSTPPEAPAPTVPAGASETRTQVGDVTHQLLRMQAQGTNPGKLLPIPGQEASASYVRYMKSFEHPIPEFYETRVSSGSKNTTGVQ